MIGLTYKTRQELDKYRQVVVEAGYEVGEPIAPVESGGSWVCFTSVPDLATTDTLLEANVQQASHRS